MQVDAIAGRYLAYRVTDLHYTRTNGSFNYIEVLNVRTGKGQEASAYPGQRGADPRAQIVSKIQILPDGRAAWIAKAGYYEDQPFLVLTLPLGSNNASSKYAILDQGPDIDPTSIALTERFIYWTRGGAAYGRALVGADADPVGTVSIKGSPRTWMAGAVAGHVNRPSPADQIQGVLTP